MERKLQRVNKLEVDRNNFSYFYFNYNISNNFQEK